MSGGTGSSAERGDDRRRHREIGRRLADAQAARDIEIDVVGADADAAARLQHGQHHRQPVESQPTTARRGVPSAEGRPAPGSRPAPAACLRCRRRRRRRRHGRAARRGTAPTGWRPRSGRGRTSRTRRSRRSGRSGSSPRAGCGTGGRARPRNRARCRPCARARAGPAIAPSLVTWPTSSTAMPRRLASSTSACAEARTWVTVPGVESTRVEPHGLDRIDDRDLGRVGPLERGDDVAHRGRGGELRPARRRGPAAAARRRTWSTRLFAGDVGAGRVLLGERRRDLQQQRRLADAGIAADQQRRSDTRPPPHTRSNSAMPLL